MSHAKRGRGSRAARAAKPAPPARRGPTPARVVAVIVVSAAVGAFAWWLAGPREGPPVSPAGVVPVPLDSVAPAARMFEAATMRSDWAEALAWQQRIAAALPRNPLALRQLGQTLHNHRYAITLPDGRTHWLLRNSLVRAEWEARALQLFDSSAVVTDDPADRARAHYWKGRTAEYEGLPLDALAEYEAALVIAPADTLLRRVCDLQRRKLAAEP